MQLSELTKFEKLIWTSLKAQKISEAHVFLMSNKNNNLQGLIEGFQANLVYYMSYDKLSKESNQVMNNLEEDPKAFLSFLQKITSSLKYFRRNFDYKGSESYLERYQTLHNNVIHFRKSFCWL
jgi:uroporphyrinogen-III decarboxylase